MKLNSIFIILILFISILYVNSDISHALKEINISTPDLARSSTDIVVAKCVSSEAKLDEKTGRIYTYVTLNVSESLQGEYKDKIVLRIVGGTVDGKNVDSPYMPHFEPGEETVLFLGAKNKYGSPVFKSINKGIYRVKMDNNGLKIIQTPVSDLTIFNSKTNQRVNSNSNILLDDFIYSINEIL